MTPSLAQVLARGGAAAHPSFDPLFLLAGISVFFLAAFSTAKGIELYRSRHPLAPCLQDDPPPLAEINNHEEAEKLSFLSDQNRQLQGKVQELAGALTSIKQTRDMLERSNLVLVKESTKLKGEKEELLLKSSEPLIAVKAAVPETIVTDVNADKKVEKKAGKNIAKKTAMRSLPVAAAKKPKAKAVKRIVKAKALRAKIIKKGDRKPPRVSRKVK